MYVMALCLLFCWLSFLCGEIGCILQTKPTYSYKLALLQLFARQGNTVIIMFNTHFTGILL